MAEPQLSFVTFQQDWPAAIIASAHRTGVVGMRDLARHGVPVSCIDCDENLPGFRGRYGRAYACPNPDEDREQWLAFMLALGKRFATPPALIPASDRFLVAIARHAEELSSAFLIGNDAPLQGRLSEKESLYSLAAEYGMPIPRTGQVRSAADLRAFAAKAVYPCLLKPTAAREWEVFPLGHPLHLQKVAVANTAEQLLRWYQMVASVSPTLTAQEIIAGPDTNKLVYFSCYDRNGERIGRAMFRELRCQPEGFGCATVCEACVDEEADAISDRFLRAVGCRGLCEIELKRDSRDGALKMIEANPRLSGSGDAATYVGVDLVWLNYLDLIGQPVVPVTQIKRDVRHIALCADTVALRKKAEQGALRMHDLVRTYKLPLAFYDMDASDLSYALNTLYRAAHIVLGAVVRKIVPKR